MIPFQKKQQKETLSPWRSSFTKNEHLQIAKCLRRHNLPMKDRTELVQDLFVSLPPFKLAVLPPSAAFLASRH